MNQQPSFGELCFGNKLLLIGYALGCVSSFLIGLGSIIKMGGSLPEMPISYGAGPLAGNRGPTIQRSGSYFET